MGRKFYSDKELILAVESCNNFTDLCLKLGYKRRPGNFNSIRININRLNLDISHFIQVSKVDNKKVYTKEDVFCENSQVTYSTVKAWVIRYNLLSYICDECLLQNVWNNKPLVLHLDHINGNRQDHRLENLRFLCPNCHSQSSTYCGRNMGIRLAKRINKCKDCFVEIDKKAIRCLKCHSKSNEKIEWPSNEDLIKLVKETNYVQVAKKLGVSDNSIRKRLRRKI